MSEKTTNIGLTLTTDDQTLFRDWREIINGKGEGDKKSNAQIIDEAFATKQDKIDAEHKLSADLIDGELGTKVVANPEDAATESLTKIKIGDDVFSVEGGSSETPVLFRHDLTYSGSCNDDATQILKANIVNFNDKAESLSFYGFAKWLKDNDFSESSEGLTKAYPATGTLTTEDGESLITGITCNEYDDEGNADVLFIGPETSGYINTGDADRYTFTDKVNDKFATDIKTIEGQSLLGTGNVDLHTPSTLKYETSESFSQHILQEGEAVTSAYFNLTDEYKTFINNHIIETIQTLQDEGFTRDVHYTQELNPTIYNILNALYDEGEHGQKDNTIFFTDFGSVQCDDDGAYYVPSEAEFSMFGIISPKLAAGHSSMYELGLGVLYNGIGSQDQCSTYLYVWLMQECGKGSPYDIFANAPTLTTSDDLLNYITVNKPTDLSDEASATWDTFTEYIKAELNVAGQKSTILDESIRYSFNEPFSIKAKGIGLRDKNNNEVGDRVSLKTINNTELFGEGNIEIAGGTTVEANPTEEATTDLEKIKIGEEVFNVAVDTSDLATKDDIDYVMGFVNYLLGKHNEAIVDTVQYEDGTTGTKLKTVDEEGNESFIIVGGN